MSAIDVRDGLVWIFLACPRRDKARLAAYCLLSSIAADREQSEADRDN
jgi:hypothetical protein